jgi:hypothetical protein
MVHWERKLGPRRRVRGAADTVAVTATNIQTLSVTHFSVSLVTHSPSFRKHEQFRVHNFRM